MKPAPFEYVAPHSLDAALAALARHGDEAKVLAGGQSLIPTMNFRLAQPAVLVDMNPIAALSYIEQTPAGGLRIGAMTRQRDLERDPLIREHLPLLAETMPHVAHPQIRNRGTLGGSLVHADPAAELPVVAVALDAQLRLRSVRGERLVDAADFFQGIFTVDLRPDELLVEVIFPPRPARTGWAMLEVARRHGDYALAGVAAQVTLAADGRCTAARLVYMSVGDRPVDARDAAGMLVDEPLSEQTINAAAELAASQEIDPAGNVHAPAAYQRHLVRVLTGRALRLAQQRAAAMLSN